MLFLNPISKLLALLCLILSICTAIIFFLLKAEKSVAKECQSSLAAFVATQNMAETEANRTAEKVIKEIRYIKERAVPKIIYIDTYTGDSNATKCDTATSLLGSYQF